MAITDLAPLSATQSTSLGKGKIDVPRNKCMTATGVASFYPQDCGYPAILGKDANGTAATLNATATIGSDGTSVVLNAVAPAGFVPSASSCESATDLNLRLNLFSSGQAKLKPAVTILRLLCRWPGVLADDNLLRQGRR